MLVVAEGRILHRHRGVSMKFRLYCSYLMLITETAVLYSNSCRFPLLKQRVSRFLGLKDFFTYVYVDYLVFY
jgi:hypothetical protein